MIAEQQKDLIAHDHYRVLHLILNRPTKRNALTLAMCDEIVAKIRAAETRDDLGCTLITANGGVFCSGMDLDEAVPVDALLKTHEDLFTIGSNTTKPIVIAVNGAALAGGLGLVAQGHFVLASPNAVFGLPEVRIGFWPFVVFRAVEAAIGRRRTLQLSLTGHSFQPQQAYEWGLVQQICAAAEIDAVSKGAARAIGKASPLAVAAGMQYVRESEGKSQREAGTLAAELREKLMATGDFKEGIASFKEKREPHWPSLPSDFYTPR